MSELGENDAKPNTTDDAVSHSKEKKIIRKRAVDPSFKSHVKYMPEMIRRSERIAKAETVINYKGVDSSESDSEEVSVGKISRATYPLIDNAFRVRDLSHNNRGELAHGNEDCATICHQCQEFTPATKALCRNDKCVAVNQQLCGPCLSSYYGEDLESALANPEWHCPFCRGICSCSLCKLRSSTQILHRFDYKKVDDPHTEDKEYLQIDESSKSENQTDVVDSKCEVNEFCDSREENSAFTEDSDRAFFEQEKGNSGKFKRTCTVF